MAAASSGSRQSKIQAYLVSGFNDFLPPGYYVDASGTLVQLDTPNGTGQGIGRQLDRFSTSVLYLNATVSQDKTNGRNQIKLQRLEKIFQMILSEDTIRRSSAKQMIAAAAIPENTREESDANHDIQAAESLDDKKNESESDEYEHSSEEEYGSGRVFKTKNLLVTMIQLHGGFPSKGIRRPGELTGTISAESTKAKKSVEEISNGNAASDSSSDADLETYVEPTSEHKYNESTINLRQHPQNTVQWVQDFSKMMGETLITRVGQLSLLSEMTSANSLDHTEKGLTTRAERVHLDAVVEEDGLNFSLGQRQLNAIARVLLRNTKVVLIDEGTSSVDAQTDALAQDTLANGLKGKTLIAIAHRLGTVLQYGQVLRHETRKNRRAWSSTETVDQRWHL